MHTPYGRPRPVDHGDATGPTAIVVVGQSEFEIPADATAVTVNDSTLTIRGIRG